MFTYIAGNSMLNSTS